MNRLVATVALFGLALGTAGYAAATFSDSAGFSGRGGFTCVSCHQPPSPHDDAVAHLDGLPEAWMPGETYTLTIRVTGGPPALPAPQPQGGFDLASNAGSFAGDPALMRVPSPQEITYQPAGTLMREWTVQWTAPRLATQPAPIGFWLAVLSANGNHVIATNTSDSGEMFDAADAIEAKVPPASAAIDAWNAMPLASPSATASVGPDGWVVDGHHADANATAVSFRLDGGEWTSRDTEAAWRLALPDAGPHSLDFRSEGAGRRSVDEALQLGPAQSDSTSAAPEARGTPLGALALLGLCLALFSWRMKR